MHAIFRSPVTSMHMLHNKHGVPEFCIHFRAFCTEMDQAHTHIQPSTDGNCSHTNIFGRSFPKHQFHTKVQRTGDIIRIQLHLAVADVVVWSSTKYAINMRWELLRVFTMRFRENSLNGISLCSMNLRNFMFMFQKCHSMKRRTSN